MGKKYKGKIIDCDIECLTPYGSGLSKFKNYNTYVYNALPGEQVKARITSQKRKLLQANAIAILKRSPMRQEPVEGHYLCCSPWQIVTFEDENRLKQQLSRELLRDKMNLDLPDLPLVSMGERYHYRNKMEFSFMQTEKGLSLAFHKRGKFSKIPIDGCILAQENINSNAKKIVQWLNEMQIKEDILKSLMIRSNAQGETIAGLFVTEENFPKPDAKVLEGLKGMEVYFSTPLSPASLPTKVLHSFGELYLVDTIAQRRLKYGLFSFFQVNWNAFCQVLPEIEPFVAGEELLDYYSGVGTISIGLADKIKGSTLVDSSEDSIRYAQENIQSNSLSHFFSFCGRAESLLEYIEPSKVMVVDPPREGLHPKILKKILLQKPKKIVYLSCNIFTCVQNLQSLLGEYRLLLAKLYNFFPASPHVEFLVVLERQERK